MTNNVDKWTRLTNIRFDNVKVRNIGDLVLAQNIPAAKPVDGLTLNDISGTCGRAFRLANMTNVVLSDINVTGYRGAYITQTNVQGSGLEEPK